MLREWYLRSGEERKLTVKSVIQLSSKRNET